MTAEWVWRIIRDYWPMFLRGAGITLLISIAGTLAGSGIGLILGVLRTVPLPEKGLKRTSLRLKRLSMKLLNGLFSVYVEVFRGTPMIVQAMVIFYGAALLLGIHMDRLGAALFIVSINTGAYMAEIVRGGIISVDPGQYEAAQAIGMNHLQTMVCIILPQAVRNILPATGNEFVINIKDTSVLNVISVTELFFQTKSIVGNNYRYFEAFFVACVMYFGMTFTVTRILRYFERRLEGPESYTLNQMQVATPEDLMRYSRQGA